MTVEQTSVLIVANCTIPYNPNQSDLHRGARSCAQQDFSQPNYPAVYVGQQWTVEFFTEPDDEYGKRGRGLVRRFLTGDSRELGTWDSDEFL